jgi:hypothetical protein
MKRITLRFLLTAILTVMVAGPAFAHESSISISGPGEGQEITVDLLPTNVVVEGTVVHSDPSNANDFQICVVVDGGASTCESAPVGGLGNVSSRPFSISVAIDTAGPHTLQATGVKDGEHEGESDIVNISIVLSQTACDTMAPPAFANLLMNDLNLPKQYAKFRGQVIRVIAFNHSNGAYGSCNYDYTQVQADVLELLGDLGFPG